MEDKTKQKKLLQEEDKMKTRTPQNRDRDEKLGELFTLNPAWLLNNKILSREIRKEKRAVKEAENSSEAYDKQSATQRRSREKKFRFLCKKNSVCC